jgi:DNA-binding IclR family transcriptional regulator
MIDFLERDLRIHRHTASKYLDELVEGGFLELEKRGKNHFYINRKLYELFTKQ